MVNRMEMKGSWNVLRGKLKERYGELTDDDLAYTEGQEDQLFGRIQQRTGRTIDDIRREFKDFFR